MDEVGSWVGLVKRRVGLEDRWVRGGLDWRIGVPGLGRGGLDWGRGRLDWRIGGLDSGRSDLDWRIGGSDSGRGGLGSGRGALDWGRLEFVDDISRIRGCELVSACCLFNSARLGIGGGKGGMDPTESLRPLPSESF